MSQGYGVSYLQSFAAILPKLLSNCTTRKLELYNEGMFWGTPHSMDLQFNQVLAAQPDLILWPVTAWDVENVDITVPPVSLFPIKLSPLTIISNTLTHLDTWTKALVAHSRTVFWIHHLLSENQAFYLRESFTNPEILHAIEEKQTIEWQMKMEQLEKYFADMQSQAGSTGVPFVVTVLPGHAQADLIASGKWPHGVNPYLFGQQVQSIAKRHGGSYLDLQSRFRTLSAIHSEYFPLDPHMTPAGHNTVARLLADGLTDGLVPKLRITGPHQCGAN